MLNKRILIAVLSLAMLCAIAPLCYAKTYLKIEVLNCTNKILYPNIGYDNVAFKDYPETHADGLPSHAGEDGCKSSDSFAGAKLLFDGTYDKRHGQVYISGLNGIAINVTKKRTRHLMAFKWPNGDKSPIVDIGSSREFSGKGPSLAWSIGWKHSMDFFGVGLHNDNNELTDSAKYPPCSQSYLSNRNRTVCADVDKSHDTLYYKFKIFPPKNAGRNGLPSCPSGVSSCA